MLNAGYDVLPTIGPQHTGPKRLYFLVTKRPIDNLDEIVDIGYGLDL